MFAMPQLDGPFQQQVLGPDVMASVAAAFRGVASVVLPPPSPSPSPSPSADPRYQVALDVDLGLLARLSPAQRDGWSRSLASLRLLLAGHPLRRVFTALEAGTLQPGKPLVCCNTPGQVYVIKPAAESVTLVFPLHFSSRQDCAIGVAHLQEFVEARRGPSLGRAPTCSFHPREPPGELAGVDLSGVLGPGGCNGGYLTFTFTRRHVAGPQLEGVVWSMATLHQFLAYHVKASKAMMHSLMRRRVNAMVELLGAGQQGAVAGGLSRAP